MHQVCRVNTIHSGMSSSILRPVLYMLLSAIAFTIVNSGVKYLAEMTTFQLVFFRAVGSSICGFLFLWKLNVSPLGNNKKILLLRSAVGLVAITLFFRSVQLMPLASAVALRYLSPLFATVFAVVLLHERVKPIQWLFVVTAFIGVVFIKGFDPRISMGALALIMISAVFSGLVYIVIRRIGNSEHPVVIVNYFMTISAIVAGTVSLFNWVTPHGFQWIVVATMGIFGFVAQYFMTRALQLAEASAVTPFKYSEVLFTIGAGWLLFGEYITWGAIAGIVLIIGSLLAIVYLKRGNQTS